MLYHTITHCFVLFHFSNKTILAKLWNVDENFENLLVICKLINLLFSIKRTESLNIHYYKTVVHLALIILRNETAILLHYTLLL